MRNIGLRIEGTKEKTGGGKMRLMLLVEREEEIGVQRERERESPWFNQSKRCSMVEDGLRLLSVAVILPGV